MICPRYLELLDRVRSAGWEAMAKGETIANYPPHRAALQHLCAHAEWCEDCRQILPDAFPELKGKTLILESLAERMNA